MKAVYSVLNRRLESGQMVCRGSVRREGVATGSGPPRSVGYVQKEHGGPELGTAAGGQEFSFWAALDRNPQRREGFTAQQVAQGKHFFISP